MLPLINLNNQSFEEIIDSAKKQIPLLNREWTDTDAHDPGITMLEMFAWLKVLQQDYMNNILPDSEAKFLKLMGVVPKSNNPAEAYISFNSVSGNIFLPSGTKLLAEDLVFETKSRAVTVDNEIERLKSQSGDNINIMDYSVLNDNRAYNIFGEKVCKNDKFTICFKKPLINEQIIALYFNIHENDEYKRNPIEASEDFIPLAQLEWEYYGEEGSSVGWHNIRVIEDETYGFLFSGLFRFVIKGNHLPFGEDKDYQIRCTVRQNDYELPPKLLDAVLNTFKAVQKDTLCQYFIFSYKDFAEDNMIIDSYLSLYGDSRLFVYVEGSWIESEDIGIKYHIERDLSVATCKLVIDSGFEAQSDENSEAISKIMIMFYDHSISKGLVLGSGTSISHQFADIKIEDLLYDDFEIMIGRKVDGKLLLKKWNKVYSLDSSGSCAEDYVLDMAEGKLIFGNHERGQVPPKGEKNIMLLSCSTTKGAMGNVKQGSIKGFLKASKDMEAIAVRQITDAKGGRPFETINDAKKQAKAKVMNINRAVTTEDYELITKMTPGLIIKNVTALPLYEPNMNDYPERRAENCVTLVVESVNDRGKALSESYIKNIRRHIDKYRLITTIVHIASTEYIGIDLFGEISIKPYYANHKDIINKTLDSFIENHNQSLGKDLSFSDIYGLLEALDCVSYIHDLYIEPSGNYIEKTTTGDIRIPPNGRFYLRKNYLNIAETDSM